MFDWKIKSTDIIVILGQRGSGKTYLIKWLIKTLAFQNTTIYDTVQSGDGAYKLKPDSLGSRIIKVSPDSDYWNEFNEPKYWQNKFLILDELDMIRYYHGNFYVRWINVGRNLGSGGIVSARRPTRLPRDITANANYSILFSAHERSVIDYYKQSYTDQVVETVKTLGNREFIIVDANSEILGGTAFTLVNNELIQIPLKSNEYEAL